jgi:magnesium-protoporphyrin O-methyltransferase
MGSGPDDPTALPAPPPEFVAGDLLEVARGGGFTRAVVMDCFIHYELDEALEALEALAAAAPRGVLFTVAPWTPLLALMHVVGRLFRGDHKAPPIVPVKEGALRAGLEAAPGLAGWRPGRTHSVHSGFYISRGVELVPDAADLAGAETAPPAPGRPARGRPASGRPGSGGPR